MVFLHSKFYFDIRTETENHILTFKNHISHFDIQNPILTFKLSPNILTFELKYGIFTFKILFWHLNWGRKSYFNVQISYFDIRMGHEYRILTFKLKLNIVFWHSKSYFDIQTEAVYRILTFEIPFWHSNWGGISHFDIQNPIYTFKLRPISYFDIQNPILAFILGRKIVFWLSKCYFDIRTEGEYHIWTFKILFIHSTWGQI